MRAFLYRIVILIINVFCPPLAVGMLSGLNEDCLLNCCLLILAVIPSHIHGFYISCVYFHRRRKVKKGIYPGGRKPFIYGDNVLNGGASNTAVDRLWRKEQGLLQPKPSQRRRLSGEPDMTQTSSLNGRGGVVRNARHSSGRGVNDKPWS